MCERPYTAAQVAEKIGVSVDRFNRSYARRVRDDGMPASLTSFGPKKFSRALIDAWLAGRRDHVSLRTAANDEFSLTPTVEQERAALAAAYGAR